MCQRAACFPRRKIVYEWHCAKSKAELCNVGFYSKCLGISRDFDPFVNYKAWQSYCIVSNVPVDHLALSGARTSADIMMTAFLHPIHTGLSTEGLAQGWGLLSQFPPFRYFPFFSALSNHTSAIEYHVYIWQVSPQLSCGDTCQIWVSFEESNMCFCQVENFAYGEINERSFSNPHPWYQDQCSWRVQNFKLIFLCTKQMTLS